MHPVQRSSFQLVVFVWYESVSTESIQEVPVVCMFYILSRSVGVWSSLGLDPVSPCLGLGLCTVLVFVSVSILSGPDHDLVLV